MVQDMIVATEAVCFLNGHEVTRLLDNTNRVSLSAVIAAD